MSEAQPAPLITCICITKDKPLLLRRSIECFLAQTYRAKELLIVYESEDTKTRKALLAESLHESICVIEVNSSANMTLGSLRNYAISLAKGDYICQWDDDDWYHVNRLAWQFNAIRTSGIHGCVLTRWLVFDSISSKAYLSNNRLWEGSILCKTSIMKTAPYLNVRMGEDTSVIDSLVNSNALTSLNDAAMLYIYIYHGKNTWNRDHWDFIFRSGTELNNSASETIAKILSQEYSITQSSNLLERINIPI